MELNEYKEKIRLYRGSLKSCDGELEEIYTYGSPEFKEWTLSTKVIGVHNMAYAAINMNHDKQKKFLSWVSAKPRKAEDIKVYFLKEI